ncbi:secreted antigen 3, partial [Babesia divergens]
NWLTKEENLSRTLTPGLIKRGFSDSELKDSNGQGSTVAPLIAKIIKHDSAKALQNALSYLLFSCPWDDALLGHAICFLYTFCSKVIGGPERFLKDPYKDHSGAFKEVCRGLKTSLQPFINGSSGLYAVCHGGATLFDNIWDDGKFDKYCDWLKENLKNIIDALETMSEEHTTWTTYSFEHAYTAGPFRFGFTFKDNKWQNDMSHRKLQGPISKLTASLKKLLADLLFVCPWDPSLLGHAICFLNTFCSQVSAEGSLEGKLKGYSGDLKTVCSTLKSQLEPFINGSSGLSAVCQKNTKLFDTLWDDSKFEHYVKWLKENLEKIIEALASMSSEAPQWILSALQSASSAGPFKYGFVFKDVWGDYGYISTLQGYISKLTGSGSGSLVKLKECLENFSTGNPGATAGGVFTGIFGLGGAGAGVAYATNAFGFQNFITGLISGFLK